jgi:group I intron endonuclease
MNSGIYAIKNIVNGKMYIGQSKDIKKRWSFHLWTLRTNRHFNPKLQNAFNKYGEKNFSFIALESCAENLLNNREVYYISLYDTVDSGYNITQGGDGSPGRKLSEQTKIKISKANSGRKNTKEEKIRKSQALKKLWKDPIFIMKMHNRPRPKISWNKGRKHTEKEKKNLSEKLKGRKISDEHKKKW